MLKIIQEQVLEINPFCQPYGPLTGVLLRTVVTTDFNNYYLLNFLPDDSIEQTSGS